MVTSGFEQLTGRFAHLIQRVESVDVRVPEDSALIGLAADLVPTVTRLIREGIELLEAVEKVYDPDGLEITKPDDADTLNHIGMLISSEFAARDLVDVTFFACSELRASHDKLLAAATRGGQLTLASNCEAGLASLRKAMVSVESAMFEFEERKPPARQWFDVEISLQIRKLYWNLRREISGDVEDDKLERGLRNVLYRIVAFRELSVYPFLRVDDRVQLRHLLKRILDWLNGKERDPRQARRIWQDLSGFTEILVQVSHRQELQDHDRQLVGQAYRLCRRGAPTLPPSLLQKMDDLLGLDSDVDQLLLASERKTAAWEAPLRRLFEYLDRAPEMPPGLVQT